MGSTGRCQSSLIKNSCSLINKQLLDEVFVICRIINVEVRVFSEPKARLISLTETLIILHITKTESHNCFIIHLKRKKQKQNPIIVLI